MTLIDPEQSKRVLSSIIIHDTYFNFAINVLRLKRGETLTLNVRPT